MTNETVGPVRFLLVDDDLFVRDMLPALLQSQGLLCVGTCPDGAEALRYLAEHDPPDVVLMDINMPTMDGIEATHLILARHAEIPVLMLTTLDSLDATKRALGAGALGYILKNAKPPAIADAVRAAARGVAVLSPESLDRLAGRGRPDTARPPTLDDREHAVLLRVCEGRSNGEIAHEMFLSESTVKNVVRSLSTKFGTTSRVTLALMAQRHGLAPE